MVLATTQIDRLIKLSPTTVSYRMKLYKEAQDLFLKAPVFGHGIGSDLLLMSKNTHNTYLSLLVTQGLIGLLAFASIVLTVISRGFRNRCFRDAILFDINSSLLSALLATTVAAVTYDLLALKVLWVLFGLIVTCSCFAEIRSTAMLAPSHVT
jgi:O-antigen ligase